jgi:hypothetical protein
MVYKIKMKRKSLFYTVNLIIPTFLISFLSVCVFYLPTDDGEKITLSLSILFALVVFFLLISKIIPPTSIVVPLISKYLVFTFIMNILSVFNTCIVISLYYQKNKIEFLHPWIQFIFLKLLPSIMFMRRKPKRKIITNKYAKAYDQLILKKNLKQKEKEEEERQQRQFKNNKFNSYQDLILSDRNSNANKLLVKVPHSKHAPSPKQQPISIDILNKRSNLYNLEKFKKTCYNDDNFSLNSNHYAYDKYYYESMRRNDNIRRAISNQNVMKTLNDAIKEKRPNDTVIKTCKSIEYIGNIIKAKAEIDEVIFNTLLHLYFKFNSFQVSKLKDKRRLEIYSINI